MSKTAKFTWNMTASSGYAAQGEDRIDENQYGQIMRVLGGQETATVLLAEYETLKATAEAYKAINTPEIQDFLKAVEREALHQRDRWAAEHDAGKTDADWFWLIGYLAGKALHKPEKMLHHIITTAAACLNWHAAKLGTYNAMRPGTNQAEET